jgi:HSP20 family molecular chaperone IbpA
MKMKGKGEAVGEKREGAAGNNRSHTHVHQSFMTSRYVWIHPSHIWRPPTDVYETEHQICVQTEVAGMENAVFSVVLEEPWLRISGHRSNVGERGLFHQLEIHTGEFLTEVELHTAVCAETLQASYHDGFFVVEIQKHKE